MTTVGLLGATGYTGRLVAAELHRRGITARLGARNPGLLESLPDGERFVVDIDQPKRLALFLDGLDAVISCVGPFVTYGDRVVDAAVAARVPYVDSTGEATFMNGVYERHADAPVPVVPACGFDYIPGDLAAAIAAQECGGEVTDVLAAYAARDAKMSRGTARSAIGMAGQVRFAPRRLTVDLPAGSKPAVLVPWGEEVTVPRHLPGARVRTAFVVPPAVAYALGAAAPVIAHTAPLTRAAAPLLRRLVERMPAGPSQEVADAGSATIVVRAAGPGRTAGVVVRCGGAYPLTACLLVEAALTVARDGAVTGALTPAQAFEPRAFLDAVSGPLLSWSVL